MIVVVVVLVIVCVREPIRIPNVCSSIFQKDFSSRKLSIFFSKVDTRIMTIFNTCAVSKILSESNRVSCKRLPSLVDPMILIYGGIRLKILFLLFSDEIKQIKVFEMT